MLKNPGLCDRGFFVGYTYTIGATLYVKGFILQITLDVFL